MVTLSDLGSIKRQPDSVCKISYWHVPGGCDYAHAYMREEFFADLEVAQKVEDKYHYPPVMAMLIPLKIIGGCE